jgi:indolepyruvate ferredoxin oxidoreductase
MSQAGAGAITSVTRARENISLDAQRALGGAVPRSHASEHHRARRGLAARGDPTQSQVTPRGAAPQRCVRRDEPRGFRVGSGRSCRPDVEQGLRRSTATPPPAHALVDLVAPEEGELRRLLAVRVDDLLGWGGKHVAERYVREVARVRAAEEMSVPGSTVLAEAVAHGLHKLIAYKDEYEVARLQVKGLRDLPRGSKVSFHLHPPLLRALGLKRKLRLGPWFTPCLRVLQHGRHLRGTPLDPFGYAHVRRVERDLPHRYLSLVDRALERLSADTLPVALGIAQLPDLVRGYEQIKLDGVERFHSRAAELLEQLGRAGGADSAT